MRAMLVVAVIACACDDHGSGGGIDAAMPMDVAESGRACAFAMQNDPTAIGSPALDCTSLMCVHITGFTPDQCTDDCETAADCVNGLASSCSAGYACTAVVSAGPFACRKVCVCADRAPATACP